LRLCLRQRSQYASKDTSIVQFAVVAFGQVLRWLVVSLSITFQTERHDHDDDVAPIMATLVAFIVVAVAVVVAFSQFAPELLQNAIVLLLLEEGEVGREGGDGDLELLCN